ncbi:hypothetical protein AcV7_007759 [Taiwanofungus camphoratus]|nr:hypothetical protein AcV7_007759 [Antrodia cinnamomea]
MTTANSPDIPTDPVERLPAASSNSVPFPSSGNDRTPAIQDSGSSSSNLTSSDKLSALPVQSSPALERLRSPGRIVRRSLDASGSLSSIDSPSGSLQALHNLPGATRTSESEGSIGKDTPKQRASLDSDHMSLPATLQGIRQAMAARRAHRSSSAAPSPSPRSGESPLPSGTPQPQLNNHHKHSRNDSPKPGREDMQTQTPTSRSPSQSRAASPLRRLGWALHRAHAREEPFVPVDPFRLRICWFGVRQDSPMDQPLPSGIDMDVECNDLLPVCLPLPALCVAANGKNEGGEKGDKDSGWVSFARGARTFLTDTLPRQTYLVLLLWLPALYWSRVARVFEDAEISKPDVQRMIDACTVPEPEGHPAKGVASRSRSARRKHPRLPLPFPDEWNPPMVSPALVRFKQSWELFVDSLLREWKTLNLVSALLCTAILTMFQVDDAADDPLTRSAALFSLVFALMSLSYGCVYIVQFGTMRSMDRASRWAEEAQETKTAIWWNIWVLLATPAVWLAWSMITFCISILSFVWRTGSEADQNPPAPLNRPQALGVRTAITVVFAFGVVNFALIINTFRKYGEVRRERQRPGDEGLRGERTREGDRGRERRNAMEEMRERDLKGVSPSMVGLGLTGIGADGLGSPGSASLAGIVREDVDLEKGDFLSAEKERRWGKLSPKL